MSTDPLPIYLHDHQGAAQSAVELLKAWIDQHGDEPLGAFASEMLTEIEADQAVLRRLSESVGAGEHTVKEAAGWFAEKAARFKLRHETNGQLGIFEGLEMLALGVLGKLALWDALAVVAVTDPRLQQVDFSELARRAKHQHARIEGRRLNAAVEVFGTAATSADAKH